jgi:hypothetical protein
MSEIEIVKYGLGIIVGLMAILFIIKGITIIRDWEVWLGLLIITGSLVLGLFSYFIIFVMK